MDREWLSYYVLQFIGNPLGQLEWRAQNLWHLRIFRIQGHVSRSFSPIENYTCTSYLGQRIRIPVVQNTGSGKFLIPDGSQAILWAEERAISAHL